MQLPNKALLPSSPSSVAKKGIGVSDDGYVCEPQAASIRTFPGSISNLPTYLRWVAFKAMSLSLSGVSFHLITSCSAWVDVVGGACQALLVLLHRRTAGHVDAQLVLGCRVLAVLIALVQHVMMPASFDTFEASTTWMFGLSLQTVDKTWSCENRRGEENLKD